MEGIDLAGVVDSDFQGIQINFALPCPAGFANFREAHPWYVYQKQLFIYVFFMFICFLNCRTRLF